MDYCFFLSTRLGKEAIYPKKIAAAIPPAAALVPPIKSTNQTNLFNFFNSTLANKLPKPVKGTVAPAPAEINQNIDILQKHLK